MATLTRAVIGQARIGATPVGYGADALLVQVGPRLSPARVGVARIGATRVGQSVTNSNLRRPLWGMGAEMRLVDKGLADPNTCSFELVEPRSRKPQSGDLVLVAIGTLKNRLFAGRVSQVSDGEPRGSQYSYQIEAEGFGKKLGKTPVFASFVDESAGNILRLLFAEYAPDYALYPYYIEDGPTIDSISFDGESLLDACAALAEQAGSAFYIDHHKRVHFGDAATYSAPWEVSDTERYSDLMIDDDTGELCTQVIVRFSKLEDRVQTWLGDGEREEFQLSEAAESVTSLTVDGVAVTYGSRYKEDNSTNDFSIQYDRGYIKNSDHATLTSGQVLRCAYTAKVPVKRAFNDLDAQRARQSLEGGDGIYSEVHKDRDIVSESDAQSYALEYLRRYAWPYWSASYSRWETLQTYFNSRLTVGMLQAVTARGYDLSLQIQRVSISIYLPSDGLSLGIAQAVQLGDRRYSLADILKDERSAETPENERTLDALNY